MTKEEELKNTIVRIEALLQEFQATGEAIPQTKVLALIQMLLDYHGAGIARMIEIIAHCQASELVQQDFVNDDLIASLLLLYGLHPQDQEQRLQRCLTQLSALFAPQQGSVELIDSTGDRVRVVYRGNSSGCGWDQIKQTIEQTIYNAAPEVELVEVIAASSLTPKLVQLGRSKSMKGI